jgi:hypothetical protein
VRLLDPHAPWLRTLHVSESGTAVGEGGRFGLGAVLVVERGHTRELLLARKSYRRGYEGNDQWAFPGGRVRPSAEGGDITNWIQASLATRVLAEVNLDLSSQEQYSPLDSCPPVVAAYTARGGRRHTVILPFTLALGPEFCPWSHDATVYAPGWHMPMNLWHEITPTNRLIAAYYLWNRLAEAERQAAQPWLVEALQQAAEWAAEVQLPAPAAPWSL